MDGEEGLRRKLRSPVKCVCICVLTFVMLPELQFHQVEQIFSVLCHLLHEIQDPKINCHYTISGLLESLTSTCSLYIKWSIFLYYSVFLIRMLHMCITLQSSLLDTITDSIYTQFFPTHLHNVIHAHRAFKSHFFLFYCKFSAFTVHVSLL